MEYFTKAEKLIDKADLLWQHKRREDREQMPCVARAHLEMAKGNAVDGEKLLDEARTLKDGGKDNIGPMLWKAIILFKRDQVEDALQWYRRALRMHPGAPAGVRLGIGACQLKLGNFEQARLAFQRALDLEPENPDALLGLAQCELNEFSPVPPGLLHGDDDDTDVDEKLEAAAETYTAAVQRGLELLRRAFNADPHHPAVNVALAQHFVLKKDGAAVDHLTDKLVRGTSAIELTTPRLRAEAAYQRARLHHQDGKLDRAEAMYTAAVQMDESFAAAAFGLAQVHLAKGDHKSAMLYAERAYAAHPDSVPVLKLYGHLRRRRDAADAAAQGAGLVSVGSLGAGAGRDKETASILKKVVEADPADLDSRLELGDALLASGDYPGALGAYETAVKIYENRARTDGGPDVPAALLNNCAVLCAMTGKGVDGYDKSKALFLRALEASAAEEGGKKTGAQLDAQKERKKAAKSAQPVAFNLAHLDEDFGYVKDANDRYGDLLDANEGMIECLLRRAAMAARQEDFDKAMELAKEAAERRPDDVDAAAYVGHLLMKQEKYKEAQEQFKRLREMPKKLSAEDAARRAAAGKTDPVTHTSDEYALISSANAAYYQAVKAQAGAKLVKSGPDREKWRNLEKEHLKQAELYYTKALQKSGSNLYAANGLGILLAEKGKINEAKATFQMVAEGLMSLGGGDHTKEDGTEDSDANANKDMLTSPDIWINQGHIQMAKGNYVAAARNYEQAQQRFFFGMDARVALYQARNYYEANSMEESKAALKRALHVAPWDHRVRFNLAYVYQEHAHRTLNRTLKGAEKGKQQGEGDGRLAQVLNAIEDFKLALQLFLQIQAALQADKQKEGKKSLAQEIGIDKKRLGMHIQFCNKALTDSQPHLEAAKAEEDALKARRDAQAAARKKAEEARAVAIAQAEAAKELESKAAEAAAAAAQERFKHNQTKWLKSQAEEKAILEGMEEGEPKRGKKGKKGSGKATKNESVYNEDDDDILVPEPRPMSKEEKEKLKATGLFDSDSEEEADDKETDADEPDEDAKAKLKAAGLASDSDDDDDDDKKEASPEKEEEEKVEEGGRRMKKDDDKTSKQAKAKDAMEAIKRKRAAAKKDESDDEEAPAQEEEPDEEEGRKSAKKRRRAVIDDDSDED